MLPTKLLWHRHIFAATWVGDMVMTMRFRRPPGVQHLNWAEHPNPALPEGDIFTYNLQFTDEPAGSDNDNEAGLLGVSKDKGQTPHSLTPVHPPQQFPLINVPFLLSGTLWSRSLNVDASSYSLVKGASSCFPFLPACVKHMRHNWSDLLNLKHCLTGLEVKDMAALSMGVLPAIKPSFTRHLNPIQGGLLAPPIPVLPKKIDSASLTSHRPWLSGPLMSPPSSLLTRWRF